MSRSAAKTDLPSGNSVLSRSKRSTVLVKRSKRDRDRRKPERTSVRLPRRTHYWGLDLPKVNAFAEFTIFPGRDNHCLPDSMLYWHVFVFQSHKKMYEGFHKLNHSDDKSEDFGAIVMPERRFKVGCRDSEMLVHPILGFVLFSKDQLGSETTAHESVHMATHFLRRKRKSLQLSQENGEREETLAYTIGIVHVQLVQHLYEHGVYGV